MSILVDKNSKVVVQGITGSEGQFHSNQMITLTLVYGYWKIFWHWFISFLLKSEYVLQYLSRFSLDFLQIFSRCSQEFLKISRCFTAEFEAFSILHDASFFTTESQYFFFLQCRFSVLLSSVQPSLSSSHFFTTELHFFLCVVNVWPNYRVRNVGPGVTNTT